MYDIQDVGARCYTFISTLQILLEDCARYGKRLIVLDRPDPLGDMAEGMLLRLDTRSFVGCCDIPLRYGLTCGEFALMVNHERDLGCDLQVIPVLGVEPACAVSGAEQGVGDAQPGHAAL